jgi:UPF0042 nucleotide-binding protein
MHGLDIPVRDFVLSQEGAGEFMTRAKDLFSVVLPGYVDEGRHYLTIAVGCTGGRHRSVALAEEVGKLIKEQGFGMKVIHRDIERDAAKN